VSPLPTRHAPQQAQKPALAGEPRRKPRVSPLRGLNFVVRIPRPHDLANSFRASGAWTPRCCVAPINKGAGAGAIVWHRHSSLQKGDLEQARIEVNGGKHTSQGGKGPNGLDEFTAAYQNGDQFLKALLQQQQQQPPLNVPGMKPQPLSNLFPGTPPPPLLGDPEQ